MMMRMMCFTFSFYSMITLTLSFGISVSNAWQTSFESHLYRRPVGVVTSTRTIQPYGYYQQYSNNRFYWQSTKHQEDIKMTAKASTTTGTTLFSSSSSSNNDDIDFQTDEENFGRGDFHLSAALNEGDVVVYQTGSWLVDGVQVGDGTPPTFLYARIETIQVVWTHNCEHGVLRGIEVNLIQEGGNDDGTSTGTFKFVESNPLVEIEFGPEQLLARVPVSWDEERNYGISSVPVSDALWYDHAMI